MFFNAHKNDSAMAALIIAAGLLFRLFYAQGFQLVPDETNYWQWSRYLAWGYHDQAPLIAWTIRMATALIGHTELAVRLPSIIAMTIASIYLVLIARHWFSPRVALHTALISQSILLFNVGGLLATADGLQAMAWIGASYHAARAFDHDRWTHWLLGGVWFGVGMLSKYTMVLFLPCIFAFALLSAPHRRLMASIRPYAACALGTFMFIPVIAWNAGNGWNSARHVAYIGGADKSFALHLNYFGDYLASQAALLTPLVFLLLCFAWGRVLRRRYPGDQWIYLYLFMTSFPVVLGFAVLSLHTRVYGNWPGAGYLTAVVLVAAFFTGERTTAGAAHRRSHRLWRITLVSSFGLTALVMSHVLWPYIPLRAQDDRAADETRGWDELGRKAAAMKAEMPHPEKTFLFGLQYQTASELAFYTPGQPNTVSINRWQRPNVYDYWWKDEDLIGSDAVGVIQDKERRQRLLEVFEHVDEPQQLAILRPLVWRPSTWPGNDEIVKVFYLYKCYGFKGGLRWIPPKKDDIRISLR